MSNRLDAQLVYGVFIGEQEDIDEQTLDALGVIGKSDCNTSALEGYAEEHNLKLVYSYHWDYGGFLLVSKKTQSFQAVYGKLGRVPEVLPSVDPEDKEKLINIAKRLNLDNPGWYLVPFYG
jgi:hypothetical protein